MAKKNKSFSDINEIKTQSESKEIPSKIRVTDKRFWMREDAELDKEESRADKPTYVAELENKLQEKEKRLHDTLTKHRQALTEFENARARLSRDMQKEVEQHRRSFIIDLLEVLDNLDRALAAFDTNANADALHEGVNLVQNQFLSKLEQMDIKRITSLGESFDPKRHEAVSMIPVSDSDKDNTIVGVIKEAYAIGNEVLRPAMVSVGQYQACEDLNKNAN